MYCATEIVAGIVQFQPEGHQETTQRSTEHIVRLELKTAYTESTLWNLWSREIFFILNPELLSPSRKDLLSTWDLSLSFKPEVIFSKSKKADWLAAFMGGVAKSSLTHILDCYCQPM